MRITPNRMRVWAVWTIGLLLIFPPVADGAAQGALASDPDAKDTSQHKVIVYFSPTGKSGAPVTDLKSEDIRVTEDNRAAKLEKLECGKPAPLLLGLAMDVSGSVRLDRNRASHLEDLEVFLEQTLGGADGAYIVASGASAAAVTEVTGNQAILRKGLEDMKGARLWGSTAVYDTIVAMASADFHGRKGRNVIVVDSDFQDNISENSLKRTLDSVQRAGATVYVLVDQDSGEIDDKYTRRARQAAENLCDESGGEAFLIQNKGDFRAALQKLHAQLSNYCALEYLPEESIKKSKLLKLKVDSNRRDVTLHAPKARYELIP